MILNKPDRWMELSDFCLKYALNPNTVQKYCKEDKIVARIMGPNNSWHIDLWEWENLLLKYNIPSDEDNLDSVINNVLKPPSRFLDNIGKTFRLLTIEEIYTNPRVRTIVYAKCSCKCGGKRTTLVESVLDGEVTSCGCEDFFVNAMIDTYEEGAKRRGYEFELTKKEFLSLITSNCYFCDSPPTKRTKVRKGTEFSMDVNGVDRLNNLYSYRIGNVVPCCWNCNRSKGELTFDEFKDWIKKVYKYQEKIGNIE